MEASSQDKSQFLKYQVKINFPKPVHPSSLLKNLKARIVQVLAGEKPEGDGRCKSFLITLADL